MSARQNLNPAPVRYETTMLGGGVTNTGVSFPGGLDLLTPTLKLQAGALRACQNFECATYGGYSRIEGYERIDGHAAPSSASYQVLQFASFTNVPTVDQVVTQTTSGATGTIVSVITSPVPYIGITMTSGVFDQTHTVTTPGPVVVGIPVPTTITIDTQTDAQTVAAAADVYRELIQPVPGSGALLGVVGMIFGGVDNLYAFRANSGGTAVNIYKSSASGWVLVPFFDIVSWTGGGSTPANDGDTLTQGGVSATVKRVMWQSGLWTGSNAVGQFVITAPTGGNFTSGAASTSSGASVTLVGAQTPISILPGGRFQFVKCNFAGQLVTRRIYGCDGVNKCFEFDGTTFAPITTGLSPDQPTNIAFHKNYLFVSQGASFFYCGAGTPFKWDSTDGGGEVATGDNVNCMLTLPGSQTTATLGIYMEANTAFFYGTDPTTFNFVTFNNGIGARQFSAQNLYDTFAFDDLGVFTLRTTLNWGNFLPTALTKNILPFVLQERDKLSATSIHRAKSQYRAYFNDGYGLWVTMINQQYLGASVVQFPNPVFCCDETIMSNGAEVTYFGSSDGLGYVYQLDMGTSFDGAEINASITLAIDPVKTPRVLKRFRTMSVDISSATFASIQVSYQLGYGAGTPLGNIPETVRYGSSLSSAVKWDSFTWDNFIWDGTTLSPTGMDMTGTGENVQVTVTSSTNFIATYTLNSIIFHYSLRRGLRGSDQGVIPMAAGVGQIGVNPI